jgi:hypothetical protein
MPIVYADVVSMLPTNRRRSPPIHRVVRSIPEQVFAGDAVASGHGTCSLRGHGNWSSRDSTRRPLPSGKYPAATVNFSPLQCGYARRMENGHARRY